MNDGCIPKDLLYSELVTGSRPAGDDCKCDLRAGNINPAELETETANRDSWRLAIKTAVQTAEKWREEKWEEKRQRR